MSTDPGMDLEEELLPLVGSDEDMTPMHMTMFGTWYGGVGGQQGCPSQEGGPRLIRFESPRWRPKTTQVRARLEVQEQHILKMTPRSHTVSVLGVLYMHGKIISWSFQWNWSHLKIPSESMGIIKTSGRPIETRGLVQHDFESASASKISLP